MCIKGESLHKGISMAARWIQDDTLPTEVTVATAQAVAVGDIIGMRTNTAIRASDEVWVTNEATTRANFVARFIGLSAQAKAAGTVRPYGNGTDNTLRVDAGGVFEIDCDTGNYEVGERVGPAKDTGDLLLASKVKVVILETESIGRVVQRGTGITKVRVRLNSVFTPASKP